MSLHLDDGDVRLYHGDALEQLAAMPAESVQCIVTSPPFPRRRMATQSHHVRILDLFCGAGGCSVGYARAGFDVVGVDLAFQKNYPYEFHQLDALVALERMLVGQRFGVIDGSYLSSFDAIHASPPCQAHTTMSNRWRGSGGVTDDHEDMIAATRDLLEATGLPYVIENVPGARKQMRSPVVLNGGMFGLGVDRPRLFDTNWPLLVPEKVRVVDPVGVYGKAPDGRRLFTRADGSNQYAAGSLEQGGDAMGIDWMEWRELAQAIPPDYCEFIGEALMQHLRSVAAA